jgi:prepilin-type N-terminal cleavage/methylation domain-containing protein
MKSETITPAMQQLRLASLAAASRPFLTLRARYTLTMRATAPNRCSLQRGLTLTETLTALVLLAIGVLCIAAVYLERSQAAPAVLVHSKASRLADEMAEAMRARRGTVHFENPVGVLCKALPPTAPPQQHATNDVVCWQDKIATTLPNGTGAIDFDADSMPKAYLITVSWTPPKSGTASYLLRVELPEIAPVQKSPLPPVPTQVAPTKSAATVEAAGPKEAPKPASATATRAAN